MHSSRNQNLISNSRRIITRFLCQQIDKSKKGYVTLTELSLFLVKYTILYALIVLCLYLLGAVINKGISLFTSIPILSFTEKLTILMSFGPVDPTFIIFTAYGIATALMTNITIVAIVYSTRITISSIKWLIVSTWAAIKNLGNAHVVDCSRFTPDTPETVNVDTTEKQTEEYHDTIN